MKEQTHLKYYRWIGVDAQNLILRGGELAYSAFDLQAHLKNQQILLLSCKQRLTLHGTKLSVQERIDFTNELANLCKANIPLLQALHVLHNKRASTAWQFFMQKMQICLQQGLPLSQALAQHPQNFNAYYIHLVASAEHTAQLAQAFANLAVNLRQNHSLKNQLQQLFFYPMLVLSVALCVLIILFMTAIPEVQQLYQHTGRQLPTATQCIITLSHALLHDGLYIFIAILCTLGLLGQAKKNVQWVQLAFDRIKMQCPLVRSILNTYYLTIWCQITADLLKAHLSLIQAIDTANQAIPNLFWKQQLTGIIPILYQGSTLSQALAVCPIFPANLCNLIQLGETTGTVNSQLHALFQIHQAHLLDQLQHLKQWIEPTLMIGLALLIGSLLIAIYSPIFQMGHVIT